MINYIINFLAILLVWIVSQIFILVYRFDKTRKKIEGMNDDEILKYFKDYYDLPIDDDFYCHDECVANACEEYDKPKCKVQCDKCK